ncbi:hypothetical protein F4819DRAFT_476660 [Hypoxylon fuscum]|nr:hypothetical protein F4819DRAFT_476660 [Hypoxylon fuscum]
MATSIQSLSPELLIKILSCTKTSPTGSSDLLPCLTVCKLWYRLAVLVLYRNVVLVNTNIELFAATFDFQKTAFVRSLTLNLTEPLVLRDEDLDTFGDRDRDPGKELERPLLRLTRMLGKLSNLQSFSLYVIEATSTYYGLDIRAFYITRLINALPPSCVNLEIDSNGHDRSAHFAPRFVARFRGPPGEERAHICESIRLVLPRMHHVRIRLCRICPTLLDVFLTPNKDNPTPENTSCLRTLLINCETTTGVCTERRSWYSDRLYRSIMLRLWRQMTSALEKFVDTPGTCSPSTTVHILHNTYNPIETDCWHDTTLVSDINSCTTRAFPSPYVEDKDGHELPVRDTVSSYLKFQALAEGQVWMTLLSGARLPRTMAETEDEVIQDLWTNEETDWVTSDLKMSSMLCDSEEATRVMWLDAEVRKDPATYLNYVPVVKDTSRGWRSREIEGH